MLQPHPDRNAPERQLIYGGEKVGKSTCWADMIMNAQKHGFDGKFYLIDTDHTWNKMADMWFPKAEKSGLVEVAQPFDLREALVVSKEVSRAAKKGDVIIIDMLDWAWDEAQYLYINEVMGEEPEDYFLAMRAEVKKAEDAGKGHAAQFGGHEGMDWTFITKVYKRFELPLTMKTRAHTIGITSERKLDVNRGATTDQIKRYKIANGMAPVGQKGIGYRFDTILRMLKRANGDRQMVMVGDRAREDLWEEVVGSRTIDIGDFPNRAFVRQYLRRIGGWEVRQRKGKK